MTAFHHPAAAPVHGSSQPFAGMRCAGVAALGLRASTRRAWVCDPTRASRKRETKREVDSVTEAGER